MRVKIIITGVGGSSGGNGFAKYKHNHITQSIIAHIESEVKNYLFDGWAGRSLYVHSVNRAWLPLDLPATESDAEWMARGMWGLYIDSFGFA